MPEHPRHVWVSCLLFLLLEHGFGQTCSAAQPQVLTYEVVGEFPHDKDAFTQGLQFDRICDSNQVCQDIFWESTGLNGRSSVRQVDLDSGKVLRKQDLEHRYFGEGLTRLKDKLYQITWRESTGFIFSANDLTPLGRFSTGLGDGWGLTTDGVHLIVTDSSPKVHFLNPDTFKVVRSLTVTAQGKPVKWLNELEVIDGELWANVWQTECIARISLLTGEVTHWVVFHGLRHSVAQRPKSGGHQIDVLNGIAWDADRKRLFVTGKLWPVIFEVAVKPMEVSSGTTVERVHELCMPPAYDLG